MNKSKYFHISVCHPVFYNLICYNRSRITSMKHVKNLDSNLQLMGVDDVFFATKKNIK